MFRKKELAIDSNLIFISRTDFMLLPFVLDALAQIAAELNTRVEFTEK